MKFFDRLSFNIPYTMLISSGNGIELPICVSNSFGAEVVCETVAVTGTRKLAVSYGLNDIIPNKLRSWIIAQKGPHEQQQGGEESTITKPPIITISRQLGSGGTEIAEKLGQQLDWDVWEREIVDKIANDNNVNREMVALLDERHVSAFEEIARALFSPTNVLTWQTYIRYLVGTIMAIGQQGKAIIIGRGANFILPEALNVRIIASFDYRVENLMKRYEIPQREAEHRLVRSDQDRAEFIKKVFGADIDDLAFYDLILRIDEFSITNAIQMILTATKMKFEDSEI